MNKYIVTYIDKCDTSDCKPHVGFVCDTKSEAENWVEKDIAGYERIHGYDVDYKKMYASNGNDTCQWNIELI